MASYFKYTACNSDTTFYSNVESSLSIGIIKFTDSLIPEYIGKCFSFQTITLNTPPSNLVTINWNSITYLTYLKCEYCTDSIYCSACDRGFSLIDGVCTKTTTTQATYSGTSYLIEAGNKSDAYCKYGLKLYPDITSLTFPLLSDGNPLIINEDNGAGSIVNPIISNLQNNLWGVVGGNICTTGAIGGRLNKVGIWSTGWPNNTELSFNFCINIEESKQYLIGIAGDNQVKLYLDGTLLINLTSSNISWGGPFYNWHVFPITLLAGSHTIKLSGLNFSSLAAFGAEIYDINLTTFQANLTTGYTNSGFCGNTPSDLEPYIIFSTKDMIGLSVSSGDGQWICPEGYTLDECNGAPICKGEITDTLKYCAYDLVNCCDNTKIYTFKYLNANGNNLEATYIFTGINDILETNQCYTISENTILTQEEIIELNELPTLSEFTFQADCNTINCKSNCSPCKCYQFTNTINEDITINYIDCNSIQQSITILANSSNQKICALAVDENTNLEYINSRICNNIESAWNCPILYTLTDCTNSENTLCTDTDLSEEYANNQIIQIEGSDICWSISLNNNYTC